MPDAAHRARLALLAIVSARHRAWRRRLRSATLEPSDVHSSLGPDDFIICGSPRSGTTLLAAQLMRPPDIVVLSEPWRALSQAPDAYVAAARRELVDGSLRDGRLDLDAIRTGEASWAADGSQTIAASPHPRTRIGVKWPTFWQLLPRMPDTRFIVTVRDPLATVASMRLHGGRLRRGLDYDIRFNRALNRTLLQKAHTRTDRRALFWELVYREVRHHMERPNVLIVRYEDWFAPGGQRRQLDRIARFLGIGPLEPQIELRPARAAERWTTREVWAVQRLCASAPALGYTR